MTSEKFYRAKVPTTKFGDTFGELVGKTAKVNTVRTFGDIDYETLNKRRFVDTVEFNKFYTVVKDFVLARLGFPVVRVELTDFQMLTAIDESIARLDYHAPDWCTQYMTFETSASINMYELPRHVCTGFRYAAYKKTLLSVVQENGTLEFDFFLKYFQDNFLFSDFYISDFLLMQMHLEQIRKILGREGSFDLVNGKYLIIHPEPKTHDAEQVIIEYKALDSDTLHPQFISWIQRYASATCKLILGQIRGKYDTLPSPAGGARLNGERLSQEGAQEQALLIEELLGEIETPPAFTMF